MLRIGVAVRRSAPLARASRIVSPCSLQVPCAGRSSPSAVASPSLSRHFANRNVSGPLPPPLPPRPLPPYLSTPQQGSSYPRGPPPPYGFDSHAPPPTPTDPSPPAASSGSKWRDRLWNVMAFSMCLSLAWKVWGWWEDWEHDEFDAQSVLERFAVPLKHWNEKSFLGEGAVHAPLPPPSFLADSDRDAITAELPPSTQLMQQQAVEALDSQRALGMTLPADVRSVSELVSLMRRKPLGSVTAQPDWPADVVPSDVILTLISGRASMMLWDLELLLDCPSGWSVSDSARLEFARGKAEDLAVQSLQALGVYQSLPVLSEEQHLKPWHMFNALTEAYVRLGKREELNAALDAFALSVEQHVALPDAPHSARAKLLRASAKQRIGERLGRCAASAGDYTASVTHFRSAMQGYLEFERCNAGDPLPPRAPRADGVSVQWEMWIDAIRSAELTPTRIMLSLANAASNDPTAGKGVALAYALAAHEAIDAPRTSASSSVQIMRDALDIAPNSNLSPAASKTLQTDIKSLLSADRCAQLILAATDRRDLSTVDPNEELMEQAGFLSDQVLDRHCNADAAATSMLIARLLKQQQNAAQFAAEIKRVTELAQQLAVIKPPAVDSK